QRQVVTQITQICWKLRRIPAIEAGLLEYHHARFVTKLAKMREEGEIQDDIEPDAPDVNEMIAAHFDDATNRPYERLEAYRMKLERGLEAATRHLHRLRE